MALAGARAYAEPARAQTPSGRVGSQGTPGSRVAPTDTVIITTATLLRHAQALTQDSLRVHEAPSPALERVARYVANQFQQAGLTPDLYKGSRSDSSGRPALSSPRPKLAGLR